MIFMRFILFGIEFVILLWIKNCDYSDEKLQCKKIPVVWHIICNFVIIMRTRYSLILPIAVILSGVLLELNSLHLMGDFLPNNILLKIWPLILVFVGLDMVISQRRIVGGLVVFFVAAALLSTQFLDGGTNNEIWQLFMKVWPILLILFGLDWMFSDRSLINAAVIITGVIILIYILFTFVDLPFARELPFKINLESILPTSVFNGDMPKPPAESYGGNETAMFSRPTEETDFEPVTYDGNGSLAIMMPSQNSAELNIDTASGKVSLKAGNNGSDFVSGTVQLDPAEKLSYNTSIRGSVAKYTLRSEGKAAANNVSNWDLALSPQRTSSINAVLNNGYIKADLRSMDLSSVSIENKHGPVDVMVPVSTNAPIKITSYYGDIRVYIPRGAVVSCVISGAGNIEYPQYTYALSGNMLTPLRNQQTPIHVEIKSNNGLVRIIETE